MKRNVREIKEEEIRKRYKFNKKQKTEGKKEKKRIIHI